MPAYIGLTVNMFYSNYFQAILKPAKALSICLLRGLLLSNLFVFILPTFFGINGIWITIPIVEFITFVVVFKMKN